MQKETYPYIYGDTNIDSGILTRFSWYVEEELDILQKYIATDHNVLHLKVKQSDGGCLYLLPNKIVQVDSYGGVIEIFNTEKHSKDQIQRVLRCFKNLAIQPLYKYVLEING